MASKPTSCIFESLRNSQTLLENDTVSVIFSCLHMPSLTPTYRKLPFTILVFGSLLLVYFAFSLHHSWLSRDVLTQLQLWGSFCFISIYITPYICLLSSTFAFDYSFVGLYVVSECGILILSFLNWVLFSGFITNHPMLFIL